MAKGDKTTFYSGRLMCDGNGNLLAHESKLVGRRTITMMDDEGNDIVGENGEALVIDVPIYKVGPQHGKPVAFHEGNYVFVNEGEPSHNDRHHERFVNVEITQDQFPDQPGYAGTRDDPTPGMEHHFQVQDGDPHFDDSADNKTRMRMNPDSAGPTQTGHTEAYVGKEE